MPSLRGLHRGWLMPLLFVGVAALLTIPWTLWVIVATYERDLKEQVERLGDRVRIHLSSYRASSGWEFPLSRSRNPREILNPLVTELLGDPTVQAVAFFDEQGNVGSVRRNDAIPIPRTPDEALQMVNADSNSYRRVFSWKYKDKDRGVIYLDLSKSALRDRFWEIEGPLLWRVGYQTAAAFIVVSVLGLMALRLWGTANRTRAMAELEQQGLVAERGLTAAVLAHEIRNPLAALRFQLHSLRRSSADAERVATTADTIDSELSRIQQLVQDYLAHEKAQALRVEAVAVTPAVRALQTIMAELLREHGARLSIVEQQPEVKIACDPHALRQVLMNLVLNAVQAMGRGGTITITISSGEGSGAISVADTGPGIPPEMKDRLFKPFATSKKEGSGIGLALVKRFVDNFGGSVAVESEPGKGATFHLKLPLADAEQPQASPVVEYAVK